MAGINLTFALLLMFSELDSFGYQSSPLPYNGDSNTFVSVGSVTAATDFPSFKFDPVPVEWDAFENIACTTTQIKFDAKKDIHEKSKNPRKVSEKKDPKMIVFKPFQSTDSTELTVKMLRVWLSGSVPVDQISKIDMASAVAMGL